MPRPRRRHHLPLPVSGRVLALVAILWPGGVDPVSAAAALPKESAAELFTDGRGLLAQGMPVLAAIPLKQALTVKGEAGLDPAQTRSARLLLASADLLGQDPEGALVVLGEVKDLGAGNSGAAEHVLQAQTLSALHRWDEAVAACEQAAKTPDPVPAGLKFITALTRGESELGRDNLTEAETWLREARKVAAENNAPVQGQARARFLLALTRLRQGEPKNCLDLLEGMVPGQTKLLGLLDQSVTTPTVEMFALPAAAKEVLLLEAEANAAEGQFQVSARLCDLALRHPSGLSPDARLHVAIRKSWYEESAGQIEEAENSLLQAIREHDEPERLQTAFSHLLALYTRHDLNSKISLGPFLSGGDALRAPYASFLSAFLTGRAGNSAQAVEMLDTLAQTYPKHPLAADARLLRIRLARQAGIAESVPVEETAEGAPAEFVPLFKFETALGWLANGEFTKAMRDFEDSAEQPGRLGLSARFNLALAALESRNQKEYRKALEALEKVPAAQAEVRALRIASAAWNLRRGSLDTARTELNELAATEPRARLLLAELDLKEGRPKVAFELAQSIAGAPATAAQDESASPDGSTGAGTPEQAEYIAFWALAAEPGSTPEAVIERARNYVEKYPATEDSQLIRFKLAELYFQQSAFAQAQREFETLSEQTKDPDLKEVADFQTARAAALSMSERGLKTALDLYAAIAKAGGKLQGDALLEQAALLRDSSKYEEATAIYEDLAKGRKPGDQVRLAALQGLAQCLFSEAGGDAVPSTASALTSAPSKKEPAPPLSEPSRDKLQRCLSVCEDILEGAETRPAWRNFALYMQGRCWQELGDIDQTLVCYTKVITKSPGDGEPEFLWLYRAGFGLVEILEARNQLTNALNVLSHLDSAGGPRAQEAAERMKMIRLKNFIWDDPALDPDTRPRGH